MGKLVDQDVDNSGETDTLADGFGNVNETHRLLESLTAFEGASIIGIDSGSGFTGDNVQDVLEELDTNLTITIADYAATTGAALIGVDDTSPLFIGSNVQLALEYIAASTGNPEGVDVLSGAVTPVTPGLVLTAVGDGTSIWQAIAPAGNPEGTDVLSTGPEPIGYVLTADGAGAASWLEGAGIDPNTVISDTTANITVGYTTDVEPDDFTDPLIPDLTLEHLKTVTVTSDFELGVPSGGNGNCEYYITVTGGSWTMTNAVGVTFLDTNVTLTDGINYLLNIRKFDAATVAQLITIP
jgi:hypothetical protein